MKPHRFSYKAIQKLVTNEHEVVAYGLKEGEISEIQIDTELVQYEDIHTVTLYLNSSVQVDFYDYIISLQPKRIIFNPGTENPKFYKILTENNIAHEVACTLVLLASNQY
jgi:predicted CoA-binding protein